MPKNLKLAHLSFFRSLMPVIRGLLTFLFPILDLFFFVRNRNIEIILLRSYESVQLKP